MKSLYTAEIIAIGGRDGHVRSSNAPIDWTMRKPHEIGGQGGGYNPEQLFAAAWGCSFANTLSSIAIDEGVDVSNAEITVRVTINKGNNDFKLSAELDVHIPGIHIEEAQHIAEKTDHACPYSQATKGNIESTVIAL